MPTVPARKIPGTFEIVHRTTGKVFIGVSADIHNECDVQRLKFVRFAHPCKSLNDSFERSPRVKTKIFSEYDPIFRMNLQEYETLERATRAAAGLAQAYHRRNLLLNAPEEFTLASNEQGELLDA